MGARETIALALSADLSRVLDRVERALVAAIDEQASTDVTEPLREAYRLLAGRPWREVK